LLTLGIIRELEPSHLLGYGIAASPFLCFFISKHE
jgi:hypothetical protein